MKENIIGIVYKIENLLNGKIYIGQTRRKDNFKYYWGSGTIIKKSIRIHGKENFKKDILCECHTIEDLNSKEREYIKHFDCIRPKGYNISDGGIHGNSYAGKTEDEIFSIIKKTSQKLKGRKYGSRKPHTEETKRLIAENSKNRVWITKDGCFSTIKINYLDLYLSQGWTRGSPKHSPESLEKQRMKMKGRTLPESQKKNISIGNKGKVVPVDVRRKISNSHIGITHSPETIEKLRLLSTGRKLSDEAKDKISRFNSGKKLSEKTKLILSEKAKLRGRTAEHNKKLAESRKKYIICEETGMIFKGQEEMARFLGRSIKTTCRHLSGRSENIKGFHYKYYKA